MAHSKKTDIYKILGIDPDKKSSAPYGLNIFQRTERAELPDNPEAPSGSLFEDYSKYNDNSAAYWKYFRVLSIVGIVTVVVILVAPLLKNISFSFGHKSDYTTSYVEEEEVLYVEKEVVEEVPSSSLPETIYLRGYINDKYPVAMRLDIPSRRGEYYYENKGSSKRNMILNITSLDRRGGKYYLTINEYSPNYDHTGTWEGSYSNGKFKGTGTYLGKDMPFSLHIVPDYETDF